MYYPLHDPDNEFYGTPRVKERGCLVIQMDMRRIWFGVGLMVYEMYNGENDGGGWDTCISIPNTIIIPA
jgi:hypothetical protein